MRFIAFCLLSGLIGTGVSSAQNQSIGGDLTGEPLLEFLRSNYTPDGTLGYNTARDSMYTILDNREGRVIGVYTYFEMPVDPNSSTPRADAFDNGNGINAEHLWPQSLGAGSEPAKSDLHHLRSSETRANQDRGNLRFGSIPDNEVDRWYNKVSREETGLIFTTTAPPVDERDQWSKVKLNDRFESKLDTKGDIARSMFYFYTIYHDEADAADSGFFTSMDEALLEWHDIDEVDQAEVLRTETISGWQGNVNPFVMDTTLIRRAYFSKDGGTDPDPDPENEELIFTESVGTVSSTTSIAGHSFDNSDLTFEGNGDVRESIPSGGYDGASGNALVFMNEGERFLKIGNINTAAYDVVSLRFGMHAFGTEMMTIEYRADEGSAWTEIQHDLTQPSGSWVLHQIQQTGIPAAETVQLRFSKNNGQQYRLDDIQLGGTVGEFTSVDRDGTILREISLNQNYPNPFNPSTSIQFHLPENQRVKLVVYDMLGREVAVLVDGMRSAGEHMASWDASNLSSGIYIYSLQTESSRITRKMTLMK